MTCEVHPLKLEFSFFKNYSYILVDSDTRHAAIIDPTWQLDVILDKVRSLGAELKCILLTHSHYDHVNLVNPLLSRFPVSVYMNRREIEFSGYRCPNLRSIEHEDVLRIGDTDLTCLHTPGHTPGGTCFQLEDSLFTGDTLFIEGCGICHAQGGCPHSMYRSLGTIRERIDGGVAVFPGHSFGKEPGTPLSHLLENNIYFNIPSEEKFVAFRMRKASRDSARMFSFR